MSEEYKIARTPEEIERFTDSVRKAVKEEQSSFIYSSIPHLVEAIRYTGMNEADIRIFFKAYGGVVLVRGMVPTVGRKVTEGITVKTVIPKVGFVFLKVPVGDWIIRRADNSLSVRRDHVFTRDYRKE